jgi:threonine dehydrogenase-like Zn-dependent dehydrogenase
MSSPTVRRPGSSIYDLIGTNDMTTDDTYFERGINLRHGYMSQYYVDDAEFIVKIPQGLKEVGVLLEPTTVVEKGIAQAYEIQRRLRVWKPKRAAVMGAGTIGLLATLVLRLKGLQVTTFGKTPKPYLNSDLIEAIGATYQSTDELSILEGAKKYGPFDIIFEATGFSPVVFDSMQALGKNGVLVLSSVTGGDRKVEVPADRINLEFVLGNKVMVGTVNANREYFEMGVKDLAQAEAEYPGWLSRLLTHPVKGPGELSGAVREADESERRDQSLLRSGGTSIMASDSNRPKRILILGSGFGGLYTALRLEKKLRRYSDVELTLVNRENFFLFTPMLHEVAAGDLDLTHIVNPVRKLLRRTHFFNGDIKENRSEDRRVIVAHAV